MACEAKIHKDLTDERSRERMSDLSDLLLFVQLFVLKERRSRFVDLLSSSKRFDDGLYDLLNDPRYLDPEVIEEIPSNQQTAEQICSNLRKLGFSDECLIISTHEDLARKPLLETLENIWNGNTALFCPVSKIGYYEGHEGWRYILRRRGA